MGRDQKQTNTKTKQIRISDFSSPKNTARPPGSILCRGGNLNGGGGRRKIWVPESDFWIFIFSYFQFSVLFFLGNIFEIHMLVRYRRINNKGVLERPGTKWKVLSTISRTLKFQYFRKVDFLMPCKTTSREKLCLCLRTVRAVTLDTPRPPQFHLK